MSHDRIVQFPISSQSQCESVPEYSRTYEEDCAREPGWVRAERAYVEQSRFALKKLEPKIEKAKAHLEALLCKQRAILRNIANHSPWPSTARASGTGLFGQEVEL